MINISEDLALANSYSMIGNIEVYGTRDSKDIALKAMSK
jgi:hypothetical protein